MTTPTRGALPGARPVRAPRGTEISCRGWQQEAVLRMLMNNLDPEVAENPDALVVYGGTGRAARSWAAFDAIVRELRQLADDETLLVQSGKPVGVFRTHPWAPRVLIANSNLVGKWATWEHFRELEAAGLMMYGQMTAGSWIYIGTQGILQGTYETFAELARQHFGGTLRGRVTLTAGLGGMGGAQPLAVTMNDGVAICVEVDEARARRRHRDRLRRPAHRTQWTRRSPGPGPPPPTASPSRSRSSGTPRRSSRPGRRRASGSTSSPTRRSAHDALDGYVPAEIDLGDALVLRANQPDVYIERSHALDGRPLSGRCSSSSGPARSSSTTATTSGRRPRRPASRTPSTTRASCRPSSGPSSARAAGPFRWAALSGDPADIAGRTGRSSSSSPTTPASAAGSRWPRSGSRSRGCRPGSAGSATASGRRPAWPSTSWSGPARSARRSSSAATTSTRAPSRHRTARPRRWPTARTRSPTGRSSTPS